MSGLSVERTLELWASRAFASLRDVKARIRMLFTQERVTADRDDRLEPPAGTAPRCVPGVGTASRNLELAIRTPLAQRGVVG
ncbi:hypothetical protein SAMN05421772_103184 [Paracoccus saliphilus]|uniref:Uncharacterized protein n=1 Tax=Paracoccus saliphilus TaxID=405559 RepID=A0AA45W2X1_9RHOB|nr:hypothetical protein SAMN05421772_103184 [Paracoccus saliphilus]